MNNHFKCVRSAFFGKYEKFSDLTLGTINSNNIDGVVCAGKFAGHLIIHNREIVFMDEWASDSLSCEDPKHVLQG